MIVENPGESRVGITGSAALSWQPGITCKVIVFVGCAMNDGDYRPAAHRSEKEAMLYAEDLTEGQQFQLGEYTISEAEILQFARQYDPVPIHTDPEAAAAGPFGGLIASGFNTIAIYQRLIVEAVWSKVAAIVGRSIEVRLPAPVRSRYQAHRPVGDPEDHAQAENDAMPSQSSGRS